MICSSSASRIRFMAMRSRTLPRRIAWKPSSWMVISGVMATIATIPKALERTFSCPPRTAHAPMAKGRMKLEVRGPEATPPESNAMAV